MACYDECNARPNGGRVAAWLAVAQQVSLLPPKASAGYPSGVECPDMSYACSRGGLSTVLLPLRLTVGRSRRFARKDWRRSMTSRRSILGFAVLGFVGSFCLGRGRAAA